MDINDNGQIVGMAQLPGGEWRGFRLDLDLTIAALQPLVGHDYSRAEAVNSDGVAVGYSRLVTTESEQAVMWVDGVAAALGVNRDANDVNDAGWIVGEDHSRSHFFPYSSAFFFDGTTAYDLNDLLVGDTPFARLTGAFGINNSGQIVGRGLLRDGTESAFLLNPCYEDCPPGSVPPDLEVPPLSVPDPGSTVLLLGIGLAGLSAWRKRWQ